MSDKKNLKYFMREHKEEIITVPGPASITDENGKVIDLEIKVLNQETIQRINDNYRKRTMATDKKGNVIINNGEVAWKIEKDSAKATRHIIAEALVYPNLKDKELMDFYGCHDITEMPLKVFPKTEEYEHIIRVVFTALGIGAFDTDEEDDEKGNSDINEAKN